MTRVLDASLPSSFRSRFVRRSTGRTSKSLNQNSRRVSMVCEPEADQMNNLLTQSLLGTGTLNCQFTVQQTLCCLVRERRADRAFPE